MRLRKRSLLATLWGLGWWKKNQDKEIKCVRCRKEAVKWIIFVCYDYVLEKLVINENLKMN